MSRPSTEAYALAGEICVQLYGEGHTMNWTQTLIAEALDSFAEARNLKQLASIGAQLDKLIKLKMTNDE